MSSGWRCSSATSPSTDLASTPRPTTASPSRSTASCTLARWSTTYCPTTICSGRTSWARPSSSRSRWPCGRRRSTSCPRWPWSPISTGCRPRRGLAVAVDGRAARPLQRALRRQQVGGRAGAAQRARAIRPAGQGLPRRHDAAAPALPAADQRPRHLRPAAVQRRRDGPGAGIVLRDSTRRGAGAGPL